MANGNWFDGWVKDVEELLGALGEQFAAFTHRGIQVAPSHRWKRWVSLLLPTTCKICWALHGTVFDTKDINTYPRYSGIIFLPPVHPNCKCSVPSLPAMKAGTATILGMNGADWYLITAGRLPKTTFQSRK